ncbi:MAG: cation diffusion facilitator family transporter [Lachnospiraceae bacterium]|nr:cation diffusion facilitator family transporter [Lachnospiraceae bacterium]
MKQSGKDKLVEDRDKVIVRVSIIGILTNILLSVFKAVIGMMSNSIAVILDAVNNLSDALSSVITIIGTKLASKLPDKKHPLGYGRVEYLTALVVAGIVMYAGLTSFVESLKKIFDNEKPDYNITSLIILAVAVIVKIILGSYVKNRGKKVNSGSLIASGSDSLFDAILSTSVLISAVIFLLTDVSLEAWVGILISVIIIKSGFEMIMETVDQILGVRADKELSLLIKSILVKEPEVRGAYDLLINNYGPDKNLASVHVELKDTMTVAEADALTRRLESKVYQETGVVLAAVGFYSYNTEGEASKIQNDVRKKVNSHDWVIQMHGFYVDLQKKQMRFDAVLNFNIEPQKGLEILYKEIKEAYPEYSIIIAPDVDISD